MAKADLRLVKTDVVKRKPRKDRPATTHRPFSLHADARVTADMLGHMPGMPRDMLRMATHDEYVSVHGRALDAGY